MTRFARAKGSKASNERIPEAATSWSDMKQQLLDKNKESEEVKKKHEADKKRESNYQAFLQEVDEEQTKSTKWAEFPAEQQKKKSGVKRKLIETETKVSKKQKTGKVKKPVEKVPPSEEELKRIEKKKEKRLRQLEKKKLKKQDSESPVKKAAPKPKNKKLQERRKKPQERMIINGKEVEIAYVDGFPIKKEDAERIHQLRKQMISKGLPRSEIKIALKLERRKAEKAFAREKKKVCFNCRKSGHNLSECPDLGNQLAESAGTGICFKCGSTEHTHFECKVVRGQEFKFAQCFICREQGHIARQCPDNARGLYPKGGACKVCGDVTHLKRDCPKFQAQQQQLEESVQVGTMGGDNPDSLGTSEEFVKVRESKRPNKIVKF